MINDKLESGILDHRQSQRGHQRELTQLFCSTEYGLNVTCGSMMFQTAELVQEFLGPQRCSPACMCNIQRQVQT